MQVDHVSALIEREAPAPPAGELTVTDAAPLARLAIDDGPAHTAGLEPAMGEFNLGESEHDFRVLDGGLLRPGAAGVWLSFYAAHGVDEVLIVDPAERTVTWLGLRDGEYHPLQRSGLIELGPAQLVEQLDWPRPSERLTESAGYR